MARGGWLLSPLVLMITLIFESPTGIAHAHADATQTHGWPPFTTKCVATWPQALYTNESNYLTWQDAAEHHPQYSLELTNGVYGGDFPDCISFNGSRAKRLSDSRGSVFYDTDAKQGNIFVRFWADNLQPEEGKFYTGWFEFASVDFQSSPPNAYVPFQQHGIARNLVQHGCTGQGEPSFPQLKARVASWGHANVFLNGSMLYEGLWLHTMFATRFRDRATHAVYADAEHTRIYSPSRCWEDGGVSNSTAVNDMALAFVACRWCENPHAQVHPQTDVNFVLDFDVQEVDRR